MLLGLDAADVAVAYEVMRRGEARGDDDRQRTSAISDALEQILGG